MQQKTPLENVVTWIGSPASVVIHTLAFVGFFAAALFNLVSFDRMLLVLTTLVSLEAIYLAIFIQMTVNQHTASLKEVEEDIDEIQEDVEELGEDLDEIQEDIEEISEDIDEIQEDVEEIQEDVEEISEDEEEEKRKNVQKVTLEQLTSDVRRVLEDLEALKGKK